MVCELYGDGLESRQQNTYGEWTKKMSYLSTYSIDNIVWFHAKATTYSHIYLLYIDWCVLFRGIRAQYVLHTIPYIISLVFHSKTQQYQLYSIVVKHTTHIVYNKIGNPLLVGKNYPVRFSLLICSRNAMIIFDDYSLYELGHQTPVSK